MKLPQPVTCARSGPSGPDRHCRAAWIVGLAALASLTGCGGADGERDANRGPEGFSPTNAISMTGVTTHVVREGVPTQVIRAERAWFDESAQTLDLFNLKAEFFNKGSLQGWATCGHGRIWLQDVPAEGIGRHDIRMVEAVRYETPAGWVLQTPRMDYTHAQSALRTAQFEKQIGAGEAGFWYGRGERAEIDLAIEKQQFSRWSEYGHPVSYVKQKESVLTP